MEPVIEKWVDAADRCIRDWLNVSESRYGVLRDVYAINMDFLREFWADFAGDSIERNFFFFGVNFI